MKPTVKSKPSDSGAPLVMVRDSLADLAERVSWRNYEVDDHAVAAAILRRLAVPFEAGRDERTSA